MARKGVLAMTAASIATVLVIGGMLPSAAQEVPPPIATEFLTDRAVFTDDVEFLIRNKREGATGVVRVDDPSRTVVARFTVQAGAEFPWHSHAGPVIVNVTQGTLTYVEAADCDATEYPAGTAFVDPGHGHVHSAFNPTGGETVLVATFFEAPEVGPLLILAEPADCPI
jgi:quercetin dioxygenase-like cupin family protein